MANKHAAASYALTLRLRDVQHRSAQATLAESLGAQRVRAEEREHAAAQLQDGLTDWTRSLQDGGFDPDRLRRLAAVLSIREKEVETSEGRLKQATVESEQARDLQALAQAHVKHATSRLKTARRRERRLKEEKALGELADNITFKAARS